MRRLLNLFLIHFYLQSSQKLPSTPLLHLPINQCQDFWWTLQLSGSQHDLWSPWSALPSRVHIVWKTQSEFALHLVRKLSFHWLEGKLTSVENRRLKNDGDGVGEEEEEEISWEPSEVEGGHWRRNCTCPRFWKARNWEWFREFLGILWDEEWVEERKVSESLSKWW